MAKTEAASGGNARPRLHSVVTTVLLILISVMIVRDLLVRRWTGASPPSQDTTQQSR
ncbi:hypothetical protein QA641_07510 [Bradyrhizobium sp. CB1650]|uniref:hypothetical protein n=1 Tax=Bradyrhizobium sp. CB1650 TaxID=3039153 RepID=UPI002435211B|nr:hypothetical protein [Bradyrhizobium sp. CB1650]WGD53735.1 hypothetical protein QA641_07510 [Bradyrhizobium sp. CB1650]